MSDTYDQVLKSSNTNNEQVHKIQGELKSSVDDNTKLQSDNSQLHEDITDLECRSMRDNMVFLGISEDIQAGAATTDPAPMEISQQPSSYAQVASTVMHQK